ncbi:GTPase Era [Mycoplasma bradburyae]|uniref:GTPase Era n=1 Tax=Mycoplasma bradburyae TaxID=2963128 RepID=UPI00234273B3|nr:GTPase Era [Mycoplasma bradburyae]MDC4163643.1 GTPase Era [Mycoplasma bradburyae]MDC4184425.1 GTPase Era [Mycoplasma bradburyae]
MKKSGIVVITGLASVGKSTLINKIAKNKVAIVSKYDQTTRNVIAHKISHDKVDYLLLDTPGFHKSFNKLSLFLNSEIKQAYKHAHACILIVDSSKKPNEEFSNLLKIMKSYEIDNLIVIYSKIDLIKNEDNINIADRLINESFRVIKTIKSNLIVDDINDIIDEGLEQLLVDDYEIPESELDENEKDNFEIREIIREKVLENTFQEVPHSVAVILESKSYNQEKKMFNIDCAIVTERESQKKIIIGKGGSMIKKIGIQARKELLSIYDCKINLKLFVKVEKEWRNDDYLIKSLGHKKWVL